MPENRTCTAFNSSNPADADHHHSHSYTQTTSSSRKEHSSSAGWELDALDRGLAIGSGALTALLDALFFTQISLPEAMDLGAMDAQKLVDLAASVPGIQKNARTRLNRTLRPGMPLQDQVLILEQLYPSPHDQLTSAFGGGRQHHHWDYSHHASPIGLFFSILSQMTGQGYGRDREGHFVHYPLPGAQKCDSVQALLAGTFSWMMHLLSDMNGSSGTIRKGNAGTGIPGPILSALTGLSSLPGFRNMMISIQSPQGTNVVSFSTFTSKLFNGTLFGLEQPLAMDLRMEMGLLHSQFVHRRYIPIVINHVIVSCLFMIRRLTMIWQSHQLTRLDQLFQADLSALHPLKNPSFHNLQVWASSSYFATGLASAIGMSWIKHPANTSGFIAEFLCRAPYLAGIDLALLMSGSMGRTLMGWFRQMKEELHKNGIIQDRSSEFISLDPAQTFRMSQMMMQGKFPIGDLCLLVLKEYNESSELHRQAIQNRIATEREMEEMMRQIQYNRAEFKQLTDAYFHDFYQVIVPDMNRFEQAVQSQGIQEVIDAGISLQGHFGSVQPFRTMDEFEDLMASEDALLF